MAVVTKLKKTRLDIDNHECWLHRQIYKSNANDITEYYLVML